MGFLDPVEGVVVVGLDGGGLGACLGWGRVEEEGA